MPSHVVPDPSAFIKLSSIGYRPDLPKLATLTQAPLQAAWSLRDAGSGALLLQGPVQGPTLEPDHGYPVWTADFSAAQGPGPCVLEVPGLGASAPFEIRQDAYALPLRAAMLGLYGLRCGCPVAFEFGGATYAHGACHVEDGLLDAVGAPGQRKAGARGWHDAGDYNKYTVNGAFSLAVLLQAWQDHPGALGRLALPFIPEHGGALPDYLAELQWQLEWLLTMQAPDGGAYHKLSARRFNGDELPDREASPRYFTPVSSQATAALAAALAQAAGVYRPLDAALAARCLAGAHAAGAWLLGHPGHLRPDLTGFSTGGYDAGPNSEASFRLWAYAQLWLASGEARWREPLEALLRASSAACDPEWDWGNPRVLGVVAYALGSRPGDAGLQTQARQAVVQAAGRRVAGRDASGYGRSLQGSYHWGSNGSVARAAVLLHAADLLEPSPALRAAAADQLSHLYGRNHEGRSQVTGQGHHPPLNPHHRPSAADGIVAPWPGLLVGGGHSPGGWVDHEDSFQTNEVAINWQAALIYNLAMLA